MQAALRVRFAAPPEWEDCSYCLTTRAPLGVQTGCFPIVLSHYDLLSVDPTAIVATGLVFAGAVLLARLTQ